MTLRVRVPFHAVWKWKGRRILDIEAWAAEHQTPMISFRWITRRLNPYTGQVVEEVEEGRMPELFFDSMRLQGADTLTRLDEADPP